MPGLRPRLRVVAAPGTTATRSLLHQRALAGLRAAWPRLPARWSRPACNSPTVLRLLRLLHLEQIGRDDAAAVGAQRALAEQRIVGRHLLHLGDDLGAVMRIAAERVQRLQVMQHGGIIAGLRHRRHRVVGRPSPGSASTRRGSVVQVPVEGFGEGQALRGLQAERMHVVDEQQQRGELLAACDDAEFGRLLDRVGGVAAGIGKADDLRLRGLRLQQERGEVRAC